MASLMARVFAKWQAQRTAAVAAALAPNRQKSKLPVVIEFVEDGSFPRAFQPDLRPQAKRRASHPLKLSMGASQK